MMATTDGIMNKPRYHYKNVGYFEIVILHMAGFMAGLACLDLVELFERWDRERIRASVNRYHLGLYVTPPFIPKPPSSSVEQLAL